jgi:3-hydroxybutyryl-CoA dehydrogenase
MKSFRDIQTIGICGAGSMGTASAVAFKSAGYRVLVHDIKTERLEALLPTTKKLDQWIDEHLGSVSNPGSAQSVEDLRIIDEQADVVLDCIVEDLDQKVELFKNLPKCRERSTIFLTTTSGLSITEIGRKSGCGHLIAGTHFWNPAHLMPLVEVIRGQDTPDNIIDLTCQLVVSINKIPVVVKRDVPGFIGNRLLHALWREAIEIVERDIASPQDVDLVARLTFGLRMPVIGPLENMDLVGLDLIETIHQYMLEDLADNHNPSRNLSAMVGRGDLGMKSGQGFYDWRIRNGNELIQKRDIQIVHQLKFLKEFDQIIDIIANSVNGGM